MQQSSRYFEIKSNEIMPSIRAIQIILKISVITKQKIQSIKIFKTHISAFCLGSTTSVTPARGNGFVLDGS